MPSSHGPGQAARCRGSWIGASARRQGRHHRESGTVPGSAACRANGTQRVPAPLPIPGIGGRSRVGCAPNAELSRAGGCRSTCVRRAGRETHGRISSRRPRRGVKAAGHRLVERLIQTLVRGWGAGDPYSWGSDSGATRPTSGLPIVKIAVARSCPGVVLDGVGTPTPGRASCDS
jgi:hypothetical protein